MGFKSRLRLSIRSPEATSPYIIHVDETGLTTVQTPKKVITAKGATRVGSVTSGDRGELVTTVYTTCASGNVLPLLLIFPRVHYRDHFVRSGPQDCIGQCSKSGLINEELFLYYLDHLINRTRYSPDHKILLILDNHESHLSLRVIDKATVSGIVMLTMLTIPPKTSHRSQALDVSVFGSFKVSCNRAIENWMRSNPGKTVTIYDIPAFVEET